jgi:hypothetical protein
MFDANNSWKLYYTLRRYTLMPTHPHCQGTWRRRFSDYSGGSRSTMRMTAWSIRFYYRTSPWSSMLRMGRYWVELGHHGACCNVQRLVPEVHQDDFSCHPYRMPPLLQFWSYERFAIVWPNINLSPYTQDMYHDAQEDIPTVDVSSSDILSRIKGNAMMQDQSQGKNMTSFILVWALRRIITLRPV